MREHVYKTLGSLYNLLSKVNEEKFENQILNPNVFLMCIRIGYVKKSRLEQPSRYRALKV